MALFAIIGAIGVALLLIGIISDGILDAVLPDVDAGGVFSLPVIGAFAGAFGITGMIATSMGFGHLPAAVAGGSINLSGRKSE